MKRVILFCALLLAAFYTQAQSLAVVRAQLEGNYSRSLGSEPLFAQSFDYRTARNHAFTFGIQEAPHRYALNLAYQIAIWGDPNAKGLFFVENRYLYRRFMRYEMQEFNGMLSLGYRNKHWQFKLGLCNRFISEIPLRLNGGEGIVFEPMNVVFDLQYHLFDEQHPWNIGMSVSNQREFIIERVTLFYYSLLGYYQLSHQWRLTGEMGVNPSGVLNLSVEYNAFYLNLGCTYSF